jgi:hypothetical protein
MGTGSKNHKQNKIPTTIFQQINAINKLRRKQQSEKYIGTYTNREVTLVSKREE